jgi:hypothetical protein
VWELPESLFWRLLPVGVIALLSLWGLVHPRSLWRVLYSRQRRYQHIGNEDEQDSRVRLHSAYGIFLTVVLGCYLGVVVDPASS